MKNFIFIVLGLAFVVMVGFIALIVAGTTAQGALPDNAFNAYDKSMTFFEELSLISAQESILYVASALMIGLVTFLILFTITFYLRKLGRYMRKRRRIRARAKRIRSNDLVSRIKKIISLLNSEETKNFVGNLQSEDGEMFINMAFLKIASIDPQSQEEHIGDWIYSKAKEGPEFDKVAPQDAIDMLAQVAPDMSLPELTGVINTACRAMPERSRETYKKILRLGIEAVTAEMDSAKEQKSQSVPDTAKVVVLDDARKRSVITSVEHGDAQPQTKAKKINRGELKRSLGSSTAIEQVFNEPGLVVPIRAAPVTSAYEIRMPAPQVYQSPEEQLRRPEGGPQRIVVPQGHSPPMV